MEGGKRARRAEDGGDNGRKQKGILEEAEVAIGEVEQLVFEDPFEDEFEEEEIEQNEDDDDDEDENGGANMATEEVAQEQLRVFRPGIDQLGEGEELEYDPR